MEEQVASGVDPDEEEEDSVHLDRPASTGPLPSADSLIRDVEELLRKQRENGSSQTSDDDEEESE